MSQCYPPDAKRPRADRQVSDPSVAGFPVKRKRRNGPFKRSRTGCGTCKKYTRPLSKADDRRGKKCDEEWSDEGFCQRCLMGQWECSGRSVVGLKRESVAPSDHAMQAHSSARGDSRDVEQDIKGARDSVEDIGTSTSASIASARVHPVSAPTSTFIPPDSELSLQAPDVPPHPTEATFTIQNISNAVPPCSWPYPTPVSAPPTINPYLPHAHPNVALQPWTHFPPSLFDCLNPCIPLAPSAHLTTFSDGSVAIDNTPFTWNGTLNDESTNLFDDFDHLFAPPSIAQSPRDTAPSQINPASRVLIINGKGQQPIRHGVSLAEIYARVVESWLVGLPSTARDYARARIMALNDSGGVMRAVRYAVATAYIFLYASDPKDPSSNHGPQPKLVEMAYKGAGVDQRKTTPNDGASPSETPTLEEAGGPADSESMVKKLRLYMDSVSAPFAADLESSKWTEDAIQELKTVVVTDKKQLSDLLWGVIDLQLVEFIRGGAAPSYNMLALGDRLIYQSYGEAHPPLTLNELCTSETISLRLYALSDISRCIVHRGRRTIFDFRSNPNTPTPVASDNNEEFTWSCYLGLPGEIAVLLAEVVNLTAERDRRSPSKIRAQAEELENAIRDWQPHQNAAQNQTGLDGTAVVSRAIAGQLWRLCALILLYQSVYEVGSLHPVLRKSHTELISLLDAIVRLPNGDLWGFLGLPSFLCATLSHTEADRRRALQHMMRPGPEKMWLDNIALISRLWEEVDETGRPVDWNEKMVREGLSVAFF